MSNTYLRLLLMSPIKRWRYVNPIMQYTILRRPTNGSYYKFVKIIALVFKNLKEIPTIDVIAHSQAKDIMYRETFILFMYFINFHKCKLI